MTLQDLLIFERFYRRLNMSAVARELFLSQSSVSYAISKLEDELGVTLFRRKGKGVQPTNEGIIFSTYVAAFKTAYEDMLHCFSSNVYPDSLKIGWSYSMQELYAIDLLAQYEALHPEVQLFTTVTNAKQMRELLTRGKLDVALVNEACEDAQFIEVKLAEAYLTFCCRPDVGSQYFGALSGHNLTAEQLLVPELPLLLHVPSGEIDRLEMMLPCPIKGVTPPARVVGMFTGFQQAKQAALRGLGVALVPRAMVQPDDGLICFNLAGLHYGDNHYLNYRRSDAENPRVLSFVRFVESFFAALPPQEDA